MQGRDGMVLVGAGGGDLLTAVVVVRRRCCSLNASIVPTSLDNGRPVCVVFLLPPLLVFVVVMVFVLRFKKYLGPAPGFNRPSAGTHVKGGVPGATGHFFFCPVPGLTHAQKKTNAQ